ncbi:MAG: N-acetylmuramoyl-L-alanine amidase [Muribaculaceae bacterium]|nr:N-acetylmuramoyl-L-alanine amidase [Muribaculaceae bacterium]
MKKSIIITSIVAAAMVCTGLVAWCNHSDSKFIREGKYKVCKLAPLPDIKVSKGKNRVQGVVLHHTACGNAHKAIGKLRYDENSSVSCHVVIDRDGTRYVLASPDQKTHHAGYSMLHGKPWCNNFTIGIEFQSVDTNRQPLTDQQIESAIDYLLPIIKKYKIPLNNIVTHEQVRNEWLKHHPDRTDVPTKVDVCQTDHQRFMTALKKRYKR